MSRKSENRKSPENRRRRQGNAPPTSADSSNLRDTSRDVRAAWAICAFLVLAVALVFGQTVDHDFVNFDDPEYVIENPNVSTGLTPEGIAWAMTARYSNNWHPLAWLSHQLDCQLYDLHPAGHHLTSVLLHAVTSVLLFLVLRRMTGDLWPSAFVAAVFAVHPLHVESVAWIAERKDVLSGLFFVLALGAYLRYVRRPSSRLRYATVAAFFALGLMAKPMLVTLPFVLLLLDYWPLRRIVATSTPRQAWRLVVEKIPFFALAALSCVITSWAQSDAINSISETSMASRIANALASYAAYIATSVCPVDLAVLYPYPDAGLPIWQPIVGLAILVLVTSLAIVRCKKNPYLLVGWLWYVGMLVPVIGLVQVGSHARADRYMYLPQIGLSITATWGFLFLVRSWPNRTWICGIVASATLLGLMTTAFVQTTYWHDSESLWNHALRCTSPNKIACFNLGHFLSDHQRYEEAAEQYGEAVRISPDYLDARMNLGITLGRLDHADAAAEQFCFLLKVKPDSAEVRFNLGIVLERLGRIDEAVAQLDRAVLLATQQDKQALAKAVAAFKRQALAARTSTEKKPTASSTSQ
jgi:protein O-mannosyl-transferase